MTHSVRRRTAVGCVVALVAAALVVLPATGAQSATPTTVQFGYTGGEQTFVVPAGVHTVTVTTDGGHGGGSPFDSGSSGGAGGEVAGTFQVSPGDVLSIIVGGDAGSGGNNCGGAEAVSCAGYGAGGGGNAFFGGGGGGGTSVTKADGASLVVAGGGGGAGVGEYCDSVRSAPGDGGDAGSAGQAGSNCVTDDFVLHGGSGGGSGLASGPGYGGPGGSGTTLNGCLILDGEPGLPGSGGAGGSGETRGGGGGGGWYGGGGGGVGARFQAFEPGCQSLYHWEPGAGGGGGGFSYVSASATAPSSGLSGRAFGANGQVTIVYTADTTPPVVTSHVSGTLGSNGWYVGDVTVSWTVDEPDSPGSLVQTGCLNQLISTDQQATSYTCSVTSDGGTSIPVTATVKRDATPPTNVSGVPATGPNGSNGWYRKPVSFVFSGSDATSGIATCSSRTYSGPDGRGVSVSGSCTDNAGNTSPGVPSRLINYDATAPRLTPVVSPNPVVLRGPVSVAPGATDATSGVANAACAPAWNATAGLAIDVCAATDVAGNAGLATATYVVQYVVKPLQSPAPNSKWKAGSTVPIKVQLTDYSGKPIANNEAAALGCRVRFAVTGAQTATGCLTYNSKSQTFQYDWKLAKTTGPAAVSVTVTYPLTSTTTSRSSAITITP